MVAQRADWWALGAAVGLHAIALGALRFAPEPVRVPSPPLALEALEVELVGSVEPSGASAAPLEGTVDLAEVVASVVARDRVSKDSGGVPADEPGELRVAPGGAGIEAGEAGESGLAGAASDGSRPGSEGAGTARAPSLSLAQLGVEGRLAYPIVRPPLRPSERQTAEVRLQRSMSQTVAQRDTELGLGPHGPIVGVLEQQVHRSTIPLEATALFRARVDERGRLVELTLLEANAGYRDWQAVGQRARQALAVRTLRVPDGARGIALDIRVVSREQLPSGADPGLDVSVGGLTVKEGKGDRSGSVDILKPELKLEMVEIPNPGGGDPIRLPQLKLGMNILNLGVDPADIGQHSRRVVSAEVVRTEPL